MRTIVVGGGITGLTAAYALAQEGVDVTLYEAADSLGGALQTSSGGGYVAELGAATVSVTDDVLWLIEALGLERERALPSPHVSRRYVLRDGRMVRFPSSPGTLLTTPLLSATAKLRLLAEPMIRARRATDDESIGDLVRRRFGDDVLRYVVDPVVAGTSAGLPGALSSRYALRQLHQLERRYGSIVYGGIRERMRSTGGSDARRTGGLLSFQGGMYTLIERVGAALGDRVVTSAPVVELAPDGHGWQVGVMLNGRRRSVRADSVVYAGPAHVLGRIGLPSAARELLAPAARIAHPPLVTLALGFRRDDVAHPLDGFGVLVPAAETRCSLLGVLFTSSIFADRAPTDHVLLTCITGGARAPDRARGSLLPVMHGAMRDLRSLLGVRGQPTFIRYARWDRGIPQPAVGHEAIVRAAARVESLYPGLVFAGNWLDAVAVGGCIASGRAAAQRARAGTEHVVARSDTGYSWRDARVPSPREPLAAAARRV